MKEDKIVLKMTKADLEAWDERIQSYKMTIKRLKARLKDNDSEYPEPDELLDWELFSALARTNARACWIDIPANIWSKLSLKDGTYVAVQIAVLPEEEGKEVANKRVSDLLKLVSEKGVIRIA